MRLESNVYRVITWGYHFKVAYRELKVVFLGIISLERRSLLSVHNLPFHCHKHSVAQIHL